MSHVNRIRAAFDLPKGPMAAGWVYLEFPRLAANRRSQPPYQNAANMLIEAFLAGFDHSHDRWLPVLEDEDGKRTTGREVVLGSNEVTHPSLGTFTGNIDERVAYRWIIDNEAVQRSRSIAAKDILKSGCPDSTKDLVLRLGAPEGFPPEMSYLGLKYLIEHDLLSDAAMKRWRRGSESWLDDVKNVLAKCPNFWVHDDPKPRLVRPLRDLVVEVYLDPPALIVRRRLGIKDSPWGHPGSEVVVRRAEIEDAS